MNEFLTLLIVNLEIEIYLEEVMVMDKCSYIVIKTGFSCSSSSLFILLICKRDDFFIYEYRETTNSNRKYFY